MESEEKNSIKVRLKTKGTKQPNGKSHFVGLINGPLQYCKGLIFCRMAQYDQSTK